MRNDAKPIIPPRQDEPPTPAAPARERRGPPASHPSGGRLRDRSLEDSARRGEGTDGSAIDLASGERSLSISVLMSALAIVVLILFLVIFVSWPKGSITPEVPGEQPATTQPG